MILITGASAGIGEATTRILASRKEPLWLIARRKDRLDQLAREFPDTPIKISALDLQDSQQIQRWLQTEAASLAQVTTLINNAGLARGMSPFQESTFEQWQETFQVNVNATAQLTHAVLPHLLKRRSGHIVFLGSVAGEWAYPNGHSYCASKAAIHSLTECIRLDIQGSGVRVTEISPGMVETEFAQVRLGDETRAKKLYQGMTPLTAQDIAETVVWTMDRPAHVNIQQVVIYPTDQASPNHIYRR